MNDSRIPNAQASIIVDLLGELGEPVTPETLEVFYGNHGGLVDAVARDGAVADIVELRTACGLPFTS